MLKKASMITGLILTTIVIIFVTAVIGYLIGSNIAVEDSKKSGFALDLFPEKIKKIEVEYVGNTSNPGIHFCGESGKLYSCRFDKNVCEEISSEPSKYPKDKIQYREIDESYPKFSPPPKKAKQYVVNRNRGLIGHQTTTQYALLEDGTVWKWIDSSNEMGESFPFWHIHNLGYLMFGLLGGAFVGLIVSAGLWLIYFLKK